MAGLGQSVTRIQVTAEGGMAAAQLFARRVFGIWNVVHSLTLYQRPEIIATKSNLANFGAFGFATPPRYEDIGFTA